MSLEAAPALLLYLQGNHYHLTKLQLTYPSVTAAWRVCKLEMVSDPPAEDITVYTVHVDQHGASCTCEDSVYRQRECKHVLAMRTVGLIP